MKNYVKKIIIGFKLKTEFLFITQLLFVLPLGDKQNYQNTVVSIIKLYLVHVIKSFSIQKN